MRVPPQLLALLSLWGLWTSVLAQDDQQQVFEDVPPLVLPDLRPLASHSFRGPIAEDSSVPGFEVTGQATRLATSPDFLRLVPPIPLAHGAVFTSNKIKSSEWIVEIAVRVHGSLRGSGRGGRGLGFWYTKTGSPTKASAKPANSNQADDNAVSFFGQTIAFDGLGIVLDASPSAPLVPRSDPAGWSFGADTSGVVSAILDDNTGNWLESYKTGDRRSHGQEAKYLERVVGECEAAFRNAPGLVWVRIAHFDKMIRVDLDLQPHTTLSQEQRHFSHHCLTVNEVSLPSGYYFGLSALASGNTEPDAVDIYAFDAWEVSGKSKDGNAAQAAPPVATEGSTAPLAGTTESGDQPAKMLQEVLTAQMRMTQAIDALARRIEELSSQVKSGGGGGGGQLDSRQESSVQGQLANIQQNLAALTGKQSGGNGPTPEEVEQQSIQYIVQVLHRMQGDIKAITVRLDTLTNRVNKSIGSVQSRVAEVFTILTRYVNDAAEARTAKASGSAGVVFIQSVFAPVAGLTSLGALGYLGWQWWIRRQESGGGRGKKMI